MKNSLAKFTLVLLALSVGTAQGQLRNQPLPVPVSEQVRLVGGSSLLDPARFTMNHGFSLSLGTGLYGGSQSAGIYTNSISYFVTDALRLTSQIHLIQPTMGSLTGNPTDGVSLYYQTALNWRISDNVTFNLALSNMPRSGRYYGGMTPLAYMQRRNAYFISPGR